MCVDFIQYLRINIPISFHPEIPDEHQLEDREEKLLWQMY